MPLATNETEAQIAFVGAGPGDPDLLTLKAQRLIARADVIIYADSLVSPDVCDHAKPEATIYGSATLTLETILDIMLKAASDGQFVVRLQSGDPSLYGALYEQRRALDRQGVYYIIVPGVSSVFAAAAVVGVELTVPDVAQSLILTRHAGRVSMPERETLRSFASHGTTLCIFLSITRVRQIVEDLLAGSYTPETPVVVVYRATWPDQQVIRATIATLVPAVKQARISRQALIIVGWALATDAERENDEVHRSHLYLPGYKHLFRGGSPDNDTEDGSNGDDVIVPLPASTPSGDSSIGQD
ncbi:MAG TPA: precorrin-4 C(11)-methyltransferase [Ktedonobacteraceae bacterium]|jgi:precorrin-4/cobalt-precorrin-4 C11-methyltransferase|nr:precorrin-4 C(11)-methyltransferase [Ktedonobacteraceae bacterium]